MALVPILSTDEVQEHIQDKASQNRLIDGTEFTPTVINLAMELAVSAFNLITPVSGATVETFTNKALLMSGTLWKMYAGQAALLARNTMNYSDGGISIPIEERFALYIQLASMYEADFKDAAQKLKIQDNMENGWGGVTTDESSFPIW